MQISAYVAFIFGVYVLTVALRMLFNPSIIRGTMNKFVDDRPLVFLTGVLALMGGATLVWFHNYWVNDWRILITVFGWMALIEGFLMIIAPVSLTRLAHAMLKSDRVVQALGAAYLPFGAFLIYCAFPYFGMAP